jgi:hypothetical protein
MKEKIFWARESGGASAEKLLEGRGDVRIGWFGKCEVFLKK